MLKKAKREVGYDNQDALDSGTLFQGVKSPPAILTDAEIRRIYELDLDGELALVRDAFLIGCYSALRESDYSRIKPHHIQKR